MKMLANRLDRIRWKQFVLAKVDRTPRKSVRERQRKYLSAMTRNKRATHEIYVVLKAMSRSKHATPVAFSRNNFAETCELWG